MKKDESEREGRKGKQIENAESSNMNEAREQKSKIKDYSSQGWERKRAI